MKRIVKIILIAAVALALIALTVGLLAKNGVPNAARRQEGTAPAEEATLPTQENPRPDRASPP